MGILLILLGLVSAGLVADFLVENHLGTAPSQSVELLGSSVRLSSADLVLVAFIAGLAFVLLVALGIRFARRSREKRRGLKRQLGDLERENSELRSTGNPDGSVRAPAEGDPSAEHP